jgi:UDP-glucose 4-epimerase
MNCLVTGGAGFIGSNLVDQLIDDGNNVFIADNLSTGKFENVNDDAWFDFEIDIAEDDLTGFIEDKGIDTIFHLAASARVQPSIEDPVSFNHTNVTGTLNLLKAAVDANVNRFVFSSSSSVYGDVHIMPTDEFHNTNPLSPYGAQKLIGEVYCKQFYRTYGLRSTCLRYFNVYGERQNLDGAYALVIGKFIQQRLNGEPMTIRGDGEQRRDFTYVGDVVKANILSALTETKAATRGTPINIGNGDNRSVNQIADMIGGDRINVDAVLEPRETLADNQKALNLLDWVPRGDIETWIQGYKKEVGL